MSISRMFGALLFAAALGSCTTAGVSSPNAALVMEPGQPDADSPYTIEVLGDAGTPLRTYDTGGKFYVLGESGERYQIHITNPTSARIEAVVSVDGLDVIDGEDGDLRKRGYVVPAGGDLLIEGFRTSTAEVATFRFSSVGESYASRKGKARNVGVIAVALFAETAPVEIITPEIAVDPTYTYDDDRKDYGGGGGEGAKRSGGGRRGPSNGAPYGGDGDSADYGADEAGGGAPGPTSRRRPPPPPDDVDYVEVEESEQPYEPDPCCQKSNRPGLGTEYGEQRRSAAVWTQFVRASDTPTATAELRYNDAGGLAALGILIGPATASPDEITVRETADPFPGDPSFSKPPTR